MENERNKKEPKLINQKNINQEDFFQKKNETYKLLT